MQGIFIKIAFAVLVLLMAVIFLWRPLTLPFSGAVVTNHFVLQTTDGPLDSSSLRGKVVAIVFAHADCQAPCVGYVGKLVKAYELLNAGERIFVRLLLISANPEKDTPARIKEFAARFHPDLIGATGKPEEIQRVADGFAAIIKNEVGKDGSQSVSASPMIHLVDAEGHFVSVLNEVLAPESIAQSLRSRIPTQLPPGR